MPNSHTHLIRLGVLALASAATLGTAGAAGATTPGGSSGATGSTGSSGSNDVPSTLAGIKAKANADITDRVKVKHGLGDQQGEGGQGPRLGPGHPGGLSGHRHHPAAAAGRHHSGCHLGAAGGGRNTARSSPTSGSTAWSCRRPISPAMRSGSPSTAIPNLQAASTKAQQYVNAGNQGVLQPLIDDLNGQIDRGEQRHRRPGGHRARLHAPAVERQRQPPSALQAVRRPGHAAVAKGRQDVKQIRAIVRNHVQGSPNSPSASGGTPTTS